MRLWTIHPRYLDTIGLIALWRESLLAKKVLEGNTRGYKYHPQLERFRNSDKPLDCINNYLSEVYNESHSRGYNFNYEKINPDFERCNILVNRGQVIYEKKHLLDKLNKRGSLEYALLLQNAVDIVHPIFTLIDGPVESWEKEIN